MGKIATNDYIHNIVGNDYRASGSKCPPKSEILTSDGSVKLDRQILSKYYNNQLVQESDIVLAGYTHVLSIYCLNQSITNTIHFDFQHGLSTYNNIHIIETQFDKNIHNQYIEYNGQIGDADFTVQPISYGSRYYTMRFWFYDSFYSDWQGHQCMFMNDGSSSLITTTSWTTDSGTPYLELNFLTGSGNQYETTFMQGARTFGLYLY